MGHRQNEGLEKCYIAKAAERNIDSEYTFEITGRKKDKTYRTDIFFGLWVDGENYSKLPIPLRDVACNVSITRSQLTSEKADLQFYRKYYVGW